MFGAVTVATLVAVAPTACSDDVGVAGGVNSTATGDRQLSGAVLDPAPDVSGLSLPLAADPTNQVQFIAEQGHYLIAYFGYTACPDVCPTTLSDIKGALKTLGTDAERVDLVFTTVDPRRDTGQIVTDYVQSFVPSARGARTDDDTALRAVTKVFGMSYETDYTDPEDPEVKHSAFAYVVDDQGSLVMQWPFGLSSKEMAADLQQLLAT